MEDELTQQLDTRIGVTESTIKTALINVTDSAVLLLAEVLENQLIIMKCIQETRLQEEDNDPMFDGEGMGGPEGTD